MYALTLGAASILLLAGWTAIDDITPHPSPEDTRQMELRQLESIYATRRAREAIVHAIADDHTAVKMGVPVALFRWARHGSRSAMTVCRDRVIATAHGGQKANWPHFAWVITNDKHYVIVGDDIDLHDDKDALVRMSYACDVDASSADDPQQWTIKITHLSRNSD